MKFYKKNLNVVKNFLNNTLIITFIFIFLFLIIDIFFGKKFLYYLNQLESKNIQKKSKTDDLHLKNSYYYSDLAPSYNGQDMWWSSRVTNEKIIYCTDQNSFRTSCVNTSRDTKEFDIFIIGDSNGEGQGVQFENTFGGLLENNLINKNIKVANLSMGGYSPTIYYLKIKKKLEENYKFNEVIIFIDVSDIQDEARLYDLDDNDLLVLKDNSRQYDESLKTDILQKKIKQKLPLTHNILVKIKYSLKKKPKYYEKNFERYGWTYLDKNNLQEYPGGLDKAINQSLTSLNKLQTLLKENEIKFSLAIYPLPAQIFHDEKNNLQVEIFSEFCEKKCHQFYNLYVPFFNEIEKFGRDYVVENFFIKNDVHFNSLGHKLIFDNIKIK